MSSHPGLGVETIDPPGVGCSSELYEQLNSLHANTIHALDLLPDQPGWEKQINNVAVILSASRSGSSLLYDAVSQSGDVIALAGEHEPWLALTGNKWPFTRSDAFDSISDKAVLLRLVRNDLLVREGTVLGHEAASLLHNRAAARQMESSPRIQKLVQFLGNLATIDQETHSQVTGIFNRESNARRPATQIGQINHEGYFVPIENPPFIDPPLARRATLDELRSKMILFKSPADAYRPGMYEELFPNARITYLHLTRGFAQTVNGLMDGWSKDDIGFISNPLSLGGNQLSIPGYSDTDAKKTYWCFDLPANWQDFTDSTLIEVCAEQWLQAHQAILDSFSTQSRIKFELLYTDPEALHKSVYESLGVDLGGYDWGKEVMSTEKPSQFRWKKRADLFCDLGKHLTRQTLAEVTTLQRELGYSMEESTWH